MRIAYQPATLIRHARTTAGWSLRELAGRAGTSHATLAAYEARRKTPNADTLARIVEACGFAMDATLTRRVRTANGQPRGQELKEVLELADAFPVRVRAIRAHARFG